MSKPKAVVLFSGGLDSCVCLAEVIRTHDVALLHLNYGQRTEARELRAFNEIADYYNVTERLVVDISWLHEIGGSSLTDESLEVEIGIPEEDSVPGTYVPFRNGNILAIAASWAEVIGATSLVVGAVEEDSSGYPDCTVEFYKKFSAAISEGTRPSTTLSIDTPVITMNKAEIVKRGLELEVPMHMSWSCYVGQEEACGKCESCMLRLRGFAAAGVVDQIPYAK
ncbi:7-cyano-7-deazaguanine synthase QueC [bacterium]|jgi:7-cyano-7-deazaguanine synthase|nr:7-cyano-7-deazaguanine synthase QueC [bacterium]